MLESDTRKLAADNNMIVNVDKAKEIVFHKHSAQSSLPPPHNWYWTGGLCKASWGYLLPWHLVWWSCQNILTICSQRCYLTKCVKGLSLKKLNTVFSAF